MHIQRQGDAGTIKKIKMQMIHKSQSFNLIPFELDFVRPEHPLQTGDMCDMYPETAVALCVKVLLETGHLRKVLEDEDAGPSESKVEKLKKVESGGDEYHESKTVEIWRNHGEAGGKLEECLELKVG